MKKIFAPAAAIAACLQLASCGTPADTKTPSDEPKTYDRLQKAQWFLGRWENNSDQGNLSEMWEQENDSTFNGASYFVIAGDTVFGEKVTLQESDGKLVYEVVTADNNEQPVAFTLTGSSGKELVFENPQHDFPKKITYTQKGDSLVAVISGNGKQETFRMKKVK